MTAAGQTMDYIAFGTGPRPLVLLQGLSTRGIRGAGLSLVWMYRLFADDYTVYLFDRRQNVEPGITVRRMAGDVAAAMDQLGLTGADVLGVSQGGMIAQYLAIDRPDLVRAMVLAVTLCKPNPTVQAAVEHWIELARGGRMRQLVGDMAEKLYSPRYLRRYRPLLPLLTLLQKPRDVERFAALARSCLSCDTEDKLDAVGCPVLVIGGGQDRIVGPEAAEQLARRLDCSLCEYEEYGHALYEEAKDFNQTVYEFFRNC